MSSLREVLRLYNQLDKAVQTNESEENKIRILDLIEKTPITAEILKETKVAKLMNELRPKLDSAAADKCKRVCLKWKKIFESSKGSETTSEASISLITTSSTPVRNTTATLSTAASPAPKNLTTPPPSIRSAPATSALSNEDPTKISFDKYLETLDTTQKIYCNQMCKVFWAGGQDLDIQTVVDKSKEIIELLFQTFVSEGERRSKLHFIASQLRLQSNNELRASVLNGSTPACDILTFKKEDFLSPKLKRLAERQQEKEDEQKALMSKKVYSPLFKCPKCDQYKVIAKQQQTRSADEPATVFMNCDAENCGYSWSNSDGTA